MSRKSKFSKEIKVQACEDYHIGKKSIANLAKEIGCGQNALNSDYGFQYTTNTFKSKVKNAGMTQSMSRVGKCIDNEPMEGFFGTLKSEMFYGKKFNSMDELIKRIKDYIMFYNERRFQKNLGCLAPMEYRSLAS